MPATHIQLWAFCAWITYNNPTFHEGREMDLTTEPQSFPNNSHTGWNYLSFYVDVVVVDVVVVSWHTCQSIPHSRIFCLSMIDLAASRERERDLCRPELYSSQTSILGMFGSSNTSLGVIYLWMSRLDSSMLEEGCCEITINDVVCVCLQFF